VREHQARRDADIENGELLMQSSLRSARTATRGFAMLEVLISLVILLLGLLGVIGLITRANTAEMESYQRVQAVILMRDMLNRINSNRAVASCYSNGPTGTQFGTGYGGAPTCTAGTAAQNNQAIADMNDWNTALLGSAEVQSGTKVGAMIGARGCVTQIDAVNNIYMIAVVWQGMNPTVAPSVACGLGQYGTDNLRRAVTVTLRIGTLS
jgi:type IV pilus assembly protein PilV